MLVQKELAQRLLELLGYTGGHCSVARSTNIYILRIYGVQMWIEDFLLTIYRFSLECACTHYNINTLVILYAESEYEAKV